MSWLPLTHSKNDIDATYQASMEYLDKNKELSERLERYTWATQYLSETIPQPKHMLFSGHIFPAMEARNELDIALSLVLCGFYRQGFVSLRSVLELALLSVFYNNDDNGNVNVRSWLKSLEATPFRKTIDRKLKSLPYVTDYDNHFHIFNELDDLRQELDNFTHTRGHRYSSTGLNITNNTRLIEDTLKNWTNALQKVTHIAAALHVLRFPVALQELPLDEKFGIDKPMGFFLTNHQIQTLKTLFTQEELLYLQEVSDNDDEAQAIRREIESRPTLTKKQLEEQSFNFDKMMIEIGAGGYEGWLKFWGSAGERWGEGSRAHFQARAKKVKKWAEEMGYLDRGQSGITLDDYEKLQRKTE